MENWVFTDAIIDIIIVSYTKVKPVVAGSIADALEVARPERKRRAPKVPVDETRLPHQLLARNEAPEARVIRIVAAVAHDEVLIRRRRHRGDLRRGFWLFVIGH